MAKKLQIRDLTLRDGQQSLFATRLKQENVDKLLPLYREAKFYIMEVWGGAVPDSVMRYLGESPWDRLRACSKEMKGISLLSALSRGRNLFGYVPYPDSVLEGFYKKAIENGLNVMRIFDALNDINNIKGSIRMINELGGISDTAVCYTVDPKGTPENEKIFTDDYFVNLALEMEKLGAKMITVKDMAGLVSPSRIYTLMPKLKKALKVPVDFHTHCTPGYGLASVLTAIIQGVDIVDTNIWWFGGGSAAPSIELIKIFCDKLGVEVDVNMDAVAKIRHELKNARKALADFDLNKDKWPKDFDEAFAAMPKEIDAEFDRAIEAAKNNKEEELLDACHKIEAYFGLPKPNELVKNAEVPGGMYSNMVANLRALGAEDVLEDAMALIPKVRRDAGLVPLVTPTSQIVGSQAVNLAMDRRKGNADYTQKNNQFISLVKGEYGTTPVPVDPKFREQIEYLIKGGCTGVLVFGSNGEFYVVEDDSLSVIDKFKLHGRPYIEHLTGGSALHMNLDEHLSKQQYLQLLKVAAKEGCNYFTFNIPNTICNECGTIDKRYLKECPHCHSHNVDYMTRIIGYLKRVSNFSQPRQEEASRRYYAHV